MSFQTSFEAGQPPDGLLVTGGTPSTDTIRVLYVDDDQDFAAMSAEFLEREKEPLTVETAASADAGLEYLSEHEVDCVVSDYEMPGRDGIDFLRAVREDHPDVPFILFTGRGSEAVASEAISAGVTDYLQKTSGTDQYQLLANRITNHVDRTRTQRELRQREIHLKQAQTVAGFGSWYTEIDSDEIFWSDEIYRIFGIDDREGPLQAEQFWAYVHPDDLDAVEDAWNAALEEGEYEVEHRIVAEDGEVRWVRERAEIDYDEAGTATSAIGVVQDITDRKERERELRLFRQAVEAAGHSIYWTDADGRIQYVNPAFESTTGYGADEAVGRNPRILKSGVHDQSFYEALWDTITSGEVWRSDVVNTTKGGDRYVVDQTIAPIEGETGDVEHFVAINADITEHRRRESELEQYERLVEGAGDGLFLLDGDGQFETVNEWLPERTGCERGQLVGRHVSTLFASRDADRIRDAVGSLLDGNGDATRQLEATLRTTSDEPVPVELRLSSVTVGEASRRIVGVARDVCHRDRGAGSAARDGSDERLARLLGHELRNPLNLALGLVAQLQTEGDGDQLDELAGELHRMEAVIEGVLTLGRVDDSAPDLERTSLRETARRCWENLDANGATLVVRTERTVQADRTWVQQLLDNLLRNAIEHGEEGVTVTIGELSDGFYVEDSGPGIPDDEREQIFDAGYTTSASGTGLGLVTVEKVVTAHGWEVRVTESDAGGTRFEITGVDGAKR